MNAISLSEQKHSPCENERVILVGQEKICRYLTNSDIFSSLFTCIAPVYDVFTNDLGMNIDEAIGPMLWGNGKVGKNESLYLFAKHHIEMGHLEYGQNTVFERNAYGEWKRNE